MYFNSVAHSLAYDAKQRIIFNKLGSYEKHQVKKKYSKGGYEDFKKFDNIY